MAAKTYPPIILGFFARGLNTNRQPLFSALTGVGLQVIQFKDYLIDGINLECSDRFTLQRAPGFTKYCSAQLAVSEKVNQFYSTRDLNGNIYPLADTNQNLYTLTPSALTSLLTKGTTNQGFIQQVGGTTYYANGTDLKKWIPPAGSMVPWGVGAPLTAPAITPGQSQDYNSFWVAGYQYSSTFSAILDNNGNIQMNAATGPPSGVSLPVWNPTRSSITYDGNAKWLNVGPLGAWSASTAYALDFVVLDSNNNIQRCTAAGTTGSSSPSWNATLGATTTDGSVTWTNIGAGVTIAFSGFNYVYAYRTVSGNLSTSSPVTSTGPILSSEPLAPLSITAWSITSNVVTFTCKNALIGGDKVTISAFGTSTFFNGRTLTINPSPSSTQFTAPFTHANSSGTENGLASPVVASLQGASSSDAECNSTATITSVTVLNGVVTIVAANNFTPGINIECSGLSTATFLNGIILQVTSATATQFTVSLPSQANSGPTSDSGTATFLAVEIYRTEDGGGNYYYDGAALNGGTWNFYDTAADTQLVTELTAPLAHQNDPPPGQVGSTVTNGGTILAWWSNRIWMAVGNLVYFDGGPDVLNGIAEECWPPGNVFEFPGQVIAFAATTGGLIVVTTDEVWAIVGGPQTVAYYPERILANCGALSANCMTQDGDTLYIYNSQKQLIVLSGSGKQELGAGGSGISPVGDLLANGQTSAILTATAWSPVSSYLTIHRQGEDSGIYLSNGVESIIRYGLNVGNFSPVRQPLVVGGVTPHAGALNSVETSAGQYSLLFNPNVTHDYIYKRDLSAYADNTHAFASSAVIGNIVVTEPGQKLAPLQFISAYLYNRGSVPSISFFPNDITPASFVPLPVVLEEPGFIPAPANLISKRWPTLMNQSATPILVRHLQVKLDFGSTDTVKNELIELGLLFDTEPAI